MTFPDGWSYYKTRNIKRESGALSNWQARLIIGESADSRILTFCQPWDSWPGYWTINTTINSCNGILDVTSSAADPQILMDALGSFSPATHKYIRIRYKVVSGTAGNTELYFLNSRRTTADADQCVVAALISDNAWHVLDVDMSTHEYWSNSNVTGWRYDFCTTNGVNMQIDYIGLVSETLPDLHCNGHGKTDFSDLRFSNSADGALDYWIESITGVTPNQLATVWVELDSVATTDTLIKCWYGNSEAVSESSGANTFILFDDFERGNDGDAIGGDWTITTGTVKISTSQEYSGARSAKFYGGATPGRAYIPQTAANGTYAIKAWLYKNHHTGYCDPFIHGNGTKRIIVGCDLSNNIGYTNAAGAWVDTGYDSTDSTWMLFEINNLDFSAGTYDIYFNDALIKSGAEMGNSSDDANVNRVANTSFTTSNDMWLDNFIVCNWRTTPPEWQGDGWSEEYVPAVASTVKTWNGIAVASLKTINGIAVASIKTWNGVSFT